MKKGSVILILLCLVQFGSAQIDTSRTLHEALAKANLMVSSFYSGDYDTYFDLIHPKIIYLLGGRDSMKKMFKQGLGPGCEVVSTELILPDKLIIQNYTFQCVFSQKQVTSVNGQKIFTLSTLIGVSYDSGQSWTFIGVSDNSLASLQIHFPELSEELDVRPQTLPILIDE